MDGHGVSSGAYYVPVQNYLVCFLGDWLMLDATRTVVSSETVRVSVLPHPKLCALEFLGMGWMGIQTGTSKA